MEETATEPLAEEQEQILQPPSQTGGRKAKYPCLACGKNVTGASVKCQLCDIWCHKTCAGLSAEAYKGLMVQQKEVGTAFWSCRACMGFAKKMNTLYQELNRRQDATDARMNQMDNRMSKSEQVVEKLSQDFKRALDKMEDDKAGNNDALCDELRERDLRKLNLVIHGVNEPGQHVGYNRDRIEADRRSCSEIFAAIGVRTNGGDLRFCRRIGERGRDARPIVIGLRTEEEKRLILERARALRGGRFDNVSIVPDLTRIQRRGEDRLSEEAARRNNNLTADDRMKNLRWLVVGRRGEKRLIKGTETVPRERPPQPRLSDFVGTNNGGRPPRPVPGGPGYQPHGGQTQQGGGNQYNGERDYGGGLQGGDRPQYSAEAQYGGVPQHGGEQLYGRKQQSGNRPQQVNGAQYSGVRTHGGEQGYGDSQWHGGTQYGGGQQYVTRTEIPTTQGQAQLFTPIVPMPGGQPSGGGQPGGAGQPGGGQPNHMALGARPRDNYPHIQGGSQRLLSPIRRSGDYIPEQHRSEYRGPTMDQSQLGNGDNHLENFRLYEADRQAQQLECSTTAFGDHQQQQQQRPRLGSKRGREGNTAANGEWDSRDYSPPKTRQRQ
jgi:hypothetical protein